MRCDNEQEFGNDLVYTTEELGMLCEPALVETKEPNGLIERAGGVFIRRPYGARSGVKNIILSDVKSANVRCKIHDCAGVTFSEKLQCTPDLSWQTRPMGVGGKASLLGSAK